MVFLFKCTANPITHAFLEFKDSDQRDDYVRSAKMQKLELNGRKIKIQLAVDVTERFHRKRMGFIKLTIRNKHQVPLHRKTLNHKKKIVAVEGQAAIKACENGRLSYNQYHNIEEEVRRLMEE